MHAFQHVGAFALSKEHMAVSYQIRHSVAVHVDKLYVESSLPGCRQRIGVEGAIFISTENVVSESDTPSDATLQQTDVLGRISAERD